MPQYVPFTTPSKLEVMAAAVVAKLTAGLSGWNVKRTANVSRLGALLNQRINWPTPAAPTVVVMRGARQMDPESDEVIGTTAQVWLVTLELAVFVFDADEAARAVTLDAAEVEVVNLLHQLERDVDFAAVAYKPKFAGSTPVAVQTDGDTAPLAGTLLEVTALVHE